MSLPDRTGGGAGVVRGFLCLSLAGGLAQMGGARAREAPFERLTHLDTHVEEPKTASSGPLEEEETTMRR